MVFRDIDQERTAEQDHLKLRQTKSTADYTAHFTQLIAATNWDDAGLKDRVKDKIARGERPDILRVMMLMAIKVNNCLYERHKEKGQTFYHNDEKTTAYMSGHKRKNWRQKNNKYGPKPMEINTIKLKKKKTFNRDCYNCGKKGHLARDCRGPAQAKKSRKAQKPSHKSLSWIGCYNNDCRVYQSKKNRAE